MVSYDHFFMARATRGSIDGAVYQSLGLAHTANVERHAGRHANSQSDASIDRARVIAFIMRTLPVVVCLILFAACASTPPTPYYWTRDGYHYSKEENYGKDEFERHWAGCEAQLALIPVARTPEPGGGLMGFGAAMSDIGADMAMRERFLANCMRAQGWRKNMGVRQTNN